MKNVRAALPFHSGRSPWFIISSILVAMFVLTACGGDDSEPEVSRVGVIQLVPVVFDPIVDAFRDRMGALNYIEGENLEIIIAASGEELAAATDVENLDLILAIPAGTADEAGNGAVIQARALVDDETPILFAPASIDLMAAEFIESITRPGANVSGILLPEQDERRFEILLDMLPDAERIYMPYNSDDESAISQLPGIEAYAQSQGIELIGFDIPSGETAIQAMDEMPDDVDAIFLHKVRLSTVEWYALGTQRGIPVSQDGTATLGELRPTMAYGPSFEALGEQLAVMAEKVLQGTPVGDLPIENAEGFLTLDVGMAEVINLTLSEEFLGRADFIDRTVVDFQPEPTAASVQQVEGSGACMTNQSSPGGTNSVCVTTSCDALEDGTMIQYTDKTEVGSCTTESLVGICATASLDFYYYGGNASTLETGCGFQAGSWQDAE